MEIYPNLFSPIKIGNLQLKNRLAMAPMATNYSTETGQVVQRQIDYYVERARGGVGLIMSESNYISLEARGAVRRLGLHTDEVVPEHRRMVEAIHRENVPIIAQLHHSGRATPVAAIGQYPVSASAVPLLTRGEASVGIIPRALPIPEIERLIDLYGEAARRAMEAGFDGLLLHAGHGYLLHQFLSPRTNHRTDRYGGSEENRARFLLEVMRHLRKKMGPEVPIMVRLTGEEHTENGYKIDFICKVARWLEEAGANAINISAGAPEELEYLTGLRNFPEGFNVPLAAMVKAEVKIPVAVVGRIKRPEMADAIIAGGKADLVWMGRPLIADPQLPRKFQEGRVEDVRECIACNLCITRAGDGLEVQCTVNPEVGREREMEIRPAERRRRVLVVGGGPAGMEAARVAAQRGHSVTLVERRPQLGGQLLLGAAAPHSTEMGNLAAYLARQVRKAGVEVMTDTEATAAMIEEMSPEVVVVAAGAKPAVPEIPGFGLPHVFTAHDVLAKRCDDRLGKRVAIIGGGLTGVSVAEYLLERGHEVTIIEMLDWLMSDANFFEKKVWSIELLDRGVLVLAKARAEAITPRGVLVSRAGRRELLPADSVVIAVGVRAERGLLARLDVDRMDVRVIGDSVSPRRIQQALEEGALLGRQL